MKKMYLFIIVTFFYGCSSIMMSVTDMDEANENITLKNGDQLSILKPSIQDALLENFKDSDWSEDRYTSTLQNELVLEFNRRGIIAQADSSKEGNFLVIHINEFEPGSGVARGLGISGLGLAESELQGIAILTTSEGKRELELKKQGHQSGTTETGDQTSENIQYFVNVLASKICIE